MRKDISSAAATSIGTFSTDGIRSGRGAKREREREQQRLVGAAVDPDSDSDI